MIGGILVRSFPSVFLASYLFCWKCVVFVVSVGLFFFSEEILVLDCDGMHGGTLGDVFCSFCVFFLVEMLPASMGDFSCDLSLCFGGNV